MQSKPLNKDIFKNIFFSGLTEEECLNIDTSHFVEKYFSAGELIIEQGTKGSGMYLISSGEVLIFKSLFDSDIELARRTSGEYIGEMALFDDELRSANVKAVTEVKVYEISEDNFFKLFNSIDQIKINIISIINSTIRETGKKLGESSISHDRTRTLLNETVELKRYIKEQKGELELINRELERKNRELKQAIADLEDTKS